MGAIARNLAAALLAIALRAADPRAEVTEFLGDIATDFSASHANGILKRFAETMPGRPGLDANIRAILAASEVSMSIEVREFSSSGTRAQATLDWYIEMRRSGDGSLLATERRRKWVKCEFEKQGKRWRITRLDPLEFFAPPPAR